MEVMTFLLFIDEAFYDLEAKGMAQKPHVNHPQSNIRFPLVSQLGFNENLIP